MKIDPTYTLHHVAGEHIVLLQDAKENKVVSLNPTAVFLWNSLFGKDFTEEDAARLLTGAYDVGMEQARTDAGKWISELHALGIIR
ncbi:MAG: PqqD family protein [Bacteroidales bacterium]|nr:PqqD family protein [Bacteroidales bacterium]MBP5395876.1 PqqD family protein [Bacteroidales bacterium]